MHGPWVPPPRTNFDSSSLEAEHRSYEPSAESETKQYLLETDPIILLAKIIVSTSILNIKLVPSLCRGRLQKSCRIKNYIDRTREVSARTAVSP